VLLYSKTEPFTRRGSDNPRWVKREDSLHECNHFSAFYLAWCSSQRGAVIGCNGGGIQTASKRGRGGVYFRPDRLRDQVFVCTGLGIPWICKQSAVCIVRLLGGNDSKRCIFAAVHFKTATNEVTCRCCLITNRPTPVEAVDFREFT
jgi:hypothetical protein